MYEYFVTYTQFFCFVTYTHIYGKTFCDLHTLLKYGKADFVAKNLLIIQLCTVDPVSAKHISKTICQNDHKIHYCDYFDTYTQVMSG